MDWELLSYVKASKHRKNILKELSEQGVKTPKELSDELDMHLSQTSKSLNELENKDLVKCLTPDKRKGKLYQLAEKGEEIRGKM